jgi:hypothetical protein
MLQTIAIAGFFVSSCSGGMPNPNRDISSGQAILDLGSAVFELREENALLQAQIDSLRGTVAYQDTILRQLATLSNVSVRPSPLSVP